MTSPLPPSIALAIRERITSLREEWRVDEVYPQPQDDSAISRDSTSTPTFPVPYDDERRQES